MANLDEQLSGLNQKLQMLSKQYQFLQKENLALKKEMEGQRLHIKEKDAMIQKLNEKVDVLKLSSPGMDAAEKKMLEQRINGYLAEIEKCLILLNS